MRKVHKWSPSKAKPVADFDLRKCRDLFPTDERVRKSDVRKCRFMCNYEGCRKEVKRVGNHLRQKHNLKGWGGGGGGGGWRERRRRFLILLEFHYRR